jgi:hypothetical protein
MRRQLASRSKTFSVAAGPAHGLEHGGAAVLQRHVQIGQDQLIGHQRDQPVHLRIGIDVVQPHPGRQLAEAAGQGLDVGAQRAACQKSVR